MTEEIISRGHPCTYVQGVWYGVNLFDCRRLPTNKKNALPQRPLRLRGERTAKSRKRVQARALE